MLYFSLEGHTTSVMAIIDVICGIIF